MNSAFPPHDRPAIIGNDATALGRPAPAAARRHWMLAIPRIFLAVIMLVVIADLLIGVLLRYVVVPVTDYFDLPSVSFFWVKEVGEFGLA